MSDTNHFAKARELNAEAAARLKQREEDRALCYDVLGDVQRRLTTGRFGKRGAAGAVSIDLAELGVAWREFVTSAQVVTARIESGDVRDLAESVEQLAMVANEIAKDLRKVGKR